MRRWLVEIEADLGARSGRGLLRELKVARHRGPLIEREGRWLVNLSSNDYLGLAADRRLVEAVVRAAEECGVGAGASRLVTGTTQEHADLERRFAAFKHAEAALLCPTGFMANLAAVTTVAGPGDLVCLDKLNHASLIDAARASGAEVRVYPHLGYDKLRRLLERGPSGAGRGRGRAEPEAGGGGASAREPRKVIVTDSVFSMDGDCADLRLLCDLAAEADAILVVDEAHGTGVLGAGGSGLAEAQGVADRVDLTVSTASKALGSLGGIVTGPRLGIEAMVNQARSFIFTTAVPPLQAAAIAAALEVIAGEPWRRARLAGMSRRIRAALGEQGWDLGPGGASAELTPIIPLVVGEAEAALALSRHLLERGFAAPAIRPPTVGPGTSRVRLSLRSDLEEGQLDGLVAALGAWRGPGVTRRRGSRST